jgi:tetratricopeptide (TPR) repeat protein
MKYLERPIVCSILVVLLGILTYSNTFRSEFVFDDQSSITENLVIRDLDNFLRNSSGYDYNSRRFVCYLTFALNYRFGGLDVTGYHATNLLIHILNSLLVYSLVRLTFRSPRLRDSSISRFSGWVALFTALLFETHPVQTQAVTYVVQRMTSLMTMFYLAALVFYARWRLSLESKAPNRISGAGSYLLSLASIVLAMKTKENAFTLPVVLILYDLFFFDAAVWKKPLYWAPILLTLLIVPVSMLDIGKPLGDLLGDVGRVTNQKSTLSRWEYLFTQFSVVTTYVRLLFLPVRQNLDYDYSINSSFFTPRAAVSFLFLFSLFAGAISLFRRSRKGTDASVSLVSFGILWFFITLAVESSIIPITDVIYEHRVYLPSVGAFAAIAGGIALLGVRHLPKWDGKVPLLCALAVVAALAAATYHRNTAWKDGVKLWSDVVAKSPGKARGYNNLGVALSDRGKVEDAIAHLRESIRIDPNNAEAFNNLGVAFRKQGRIDEAEAQFRQALRIKPNDAVAQNSLGVVLGQKGKFDEAIARFREALRLKSDYASAHYNLGFALLRQSKADEAMEHFLAVLRMKPGDPKTLYQMKKARNMGR